MQKIVIVGASLAGTHALQALRAGGFTGDIVLVGDEIEQPYDRPPLSKQFITKEATREDIALLQPREVQDLRVDLRLGSSAGSLDIHGRRVVLSNGTELSYDGLVIATGARPRTLPIAVSGTQATRIHYIRTAEDACGLAAALRPGSRLGVLGGGFLGAEVASSARRLGVEVTVLERDPVPMCSALGSMIGTELAQIMRAQGVELHTEVSVTAIGADEKHAYVSSADGSELGFDHLLVSIGAVPNIEWLEGSGLELNDGVVTDERLFVCDDIVAAGDVVRMRGADGVLARRMEHWTNAAAQGEAAATNLIAGPASAVAFRAMPYVWSDQHGVRFEILGSPARADRVEELWSSSDRSQRLFLCSRGSEPVALIGFNAMRWLLSIRRSLRDSAEFTADVLDDLTRAVRAAS